MKLVTWNLNGLENRNLDMRTEAAMFQILLGAPIEEAITEGFKPNTPDIVVLQEVVERSYHAHIVPHLTAAGFHVFPEAPSERCYFEVIAVRQKIFESTYTPFSYSQQGRGLTILRLDGLIVMTAHLESMKSGTSERIDQAQFVLEEMAKHSACIFAGDTNLRKAEWKSLTHKQIKDAWQSVGSPENHRTTWKMKNVKSRYDRIWTQDIQVTNFEVFGKDFIPSLKVRPSDHFGLRVTFNLERPLNENMTKEK